MLLGEHDSLFGAERDLDRASSRKREARKDADGVHRHHHRFRE